MEYSKRQFDNNTTFFDIGLDKKIENFATLYCIMPNVTKKRSHITQLALRYLLHDSKLTNQEIQVAKSIIDDSYYTKIKRYSHCILCTDEFQREVLKKYSSKFKFWELCFPTVPYFPGNMMIYLKDRFNSKKENFQDLTIDELNELKNIMIDLHHILNERLFEGELTGINILFNQISKSQLCIHGHLELMIRNIDKLDYGCVLLNKRFYDPATNIINSNFENINNLILTNEDLSSLEIIKEYERKIMELIILGKKLRNESKNIQNEFELLLFNGLSPAPTNSVYITSYRNEMYLSSVPELIPPTISINDIGSLDDEENMYLIKYNATTPNVNYSIIKKYSPIVRPSSKVSSKNANFDRIKKLTKDIRGVLE